MKRYSPVLFVLVLLLLCVSIVQATPVVRPICPKSDTTATFTLQQGWFNNLPVWYFCTDTNDINFASTNQFPYRPMTLAPPLVSLFPGVGAGLVFFNTGFQQGPVFSAIPGQAGYSGLWVVQFIIWNPGFTPRPICSHGQVLSLQASGAITVSFTYGTTRSKAVIDCPIMVVGQLANPLPTMPTNTTPYASRQVLALNPATKQVTIPAYTVYCQEQISKFIDRCRLIIPDVADPLLAQQLRANIAPLLTLVDPANRQNFFCVTGGPTGVLRAPNQLPVICQCPMGFGARQTNRFYTPVMNLIDLNPGPAFPAFPNLQLCFVNNCTSIEMAIARGVYIPTVRTVINAPVLDCARIVPPSGGCCPQP